MADEIKPATKVEPALARHILPTAGTMLGICATLIGLVKLLEGRIGPSHVDEYGGLTALLFLVSSLSSYFSIRNDHRPRLSRWCERLADICFLAGLLSLSALSILFAYELI